ncbi:MAG: hypothetical protein JWM32_2419 [Verrucomicrobia bacterium]|nr:hypothetical protein [Verrucomicrobiota bacterium]
MIIDHLNCWPLYADVSRRFPLAFKFLAALDPAMPSGRHDIDGDNVFAIVVRGRTSLALDEVLEAHRNYIDIQYVHSGEEVMLWAPLASLSAVTMAYDPEQDASLHASSPLAQPMHVRARHFAIFFPSDGHLPSRAVNGVVGDVLKVVIKVRV